MEREPSFDYIVIGAGASGCVLSHRLSADPGTRVLLLEAGGSDENPQIADIGGFVSLWGADLDWKILTEAQAGLAGRRILINQGKVIGGSTSINAMMWVRGNRRNYDGWSSLGNVGWSYQEVLPYFKRVEDYEGGAFEFRGVGGPISVRDCPDSASRSEPFMVGATELGYDGPNWDTNGARQENGAGLLQFSITRQGQRASAATAYLTPILDRPNLRIKPRAEVARLLIEGTRVRGVEYIQGGQRARAYAEKEVILSAGAFQSPKILMLSGLGPADHLKARGVTPIVDLPGVGQNLLDHLQLPVVYRSRIDFPRPSLLTGNVLFVNSCRNGGETSPDLQLNFTPSVPGPLAPMLDFGGPASIFLPILVQPVSVGEVKLRSANPRDPPIVNPNYLQSPADVEALVRAIRLIRELTNTRAFRESNGGELVPGVNADLEGFIRTQCSTLWHPVGTCRMGHDDHAVVDSSLRVRGVDGLRVADASIMPTVPSGNPQAACYMIGEKLAAMMTGRD